MGKMGGRWVVVPGWYVWVIWKCDLLLRVDSNLIGFTECGVLDSPGRIHLCVKTWRGIVFTGLIVLLSWEEIDLKGRRLMPRAKGKQLMD